MEPKRGAIARCDRNQLGIILYDKPQRIQYVAGEWSDLWVGVLLETPGTFAGIWTSRKPNVLGYVPEYILKKVIEINKPLQLKE